MPRGAGDLIANVLHWVGVRKVEGCDCTERQLWFNRAVPFQ